MWFCTTDDACVLYQEHDAYALFSMLMIHLTDSFAPPQVRPFMAALPLFTDALLLFMATNLPLMTVMLPLMAATAGT